jgi:hypothetical protein
MIKVPIKMSSPAVLYLKHAVQGEISKMQPCYTQILALTNMHMNEIHAVHELPASRWK